jgi:exodeoxyribonuclease V alpha subunit
MELHGQIERITYSSEETGFTIARVKVEGRRELVTVVGKLVAPRVGEAIRMKGEWANHPRYGEQFKIVQYRTEIPATLHGIGRYLGSGLIRGIGPVMAERIVEKFGQETLEVIENQVERLAEVEGIGKKRITIIRRAWAEQKEIREVMIFLQAYGVSSGYATKIFKYYGSKSIEVVKQNPYTLASDVFGIGFIIADSIAEKLGFTRDSELRGEAGIVYVLNQLVEEGHVYYPYEPLLEKCREMLQVGREVVVKSFAKLALEKKVVVEDLNQDIDDFRENYKAVYLARFHLAETSIALRLKTLINSAKAIRKIDTDKAVQWVQKQLDITLAARQVEAIGSAVEDKVLVLTGGPGTGKTTIINAVVRIFARLGVDIMLAAPTGRAAKRMSEATGHEAKTIHRLLEYSMQKGGFQRTQHRPLKCDLLIVDEASMIDTMLMHHLLKAMPPEATFILVGDVSQLPSVGAGNILKDIIASGAVPVVELKEIFRQAQESSIIVNAHKIDSGQLPSLAASEKIDQDFYFIEQEEPAEVLRIILELAKERIPRRFGFDPVDDIQVLAPMHKGVAGAANLNTELQKTLNPGEGGITRGDGQFRVNDKVMQIRNNYDKEIFNGDIGRIIHIDSINQEVAIGFDGTEVVYEFSELDELVLAYAISVHKSQGSEYPAVILPVLTQHYVLLQRNLLYTGVTRGRELVVLVGSSKALAIAVNNDKTQRRYTHLRSRLSG